MLLTIVLDLFFGLEMPTWQIEANLNAAYAQDMNQSFIGRFSLILAPRRPLCHRGDLTLI